jgi:hypothetical protein
MTFPLNYHFLFMMLNTVLWLKPLILIPAILSHRFSDEQNCTCSGSLVNISHDNPSFLLMPTINEVYCRPMSCNWTIRTNYSDYTFLLQVNIYTFLSPSDRFIIMNCNTSELYNSNTSKNYDTLYTQEAKICIYFNSSQTIGYGSAKIFHWTIEFLLINSPKNIEVRIEIVFIIFDSRI